jgi:hypothetical protein
MNSMQMPPRMRSTPINVDRTEFWSAAQYRSVISALSKAFELQVRREVAAFRIVYRRH